MSQRVSQPLLLLNATEIIMFEADLCGNKYDDFLKNMFFVCFFCFCFQINWTVERPGQGGPRGGFISSELNQHPR